jgi:hypothetical protein
MSESVVDGTGIPQSRIRIQVREIEASRPIGRQEGYSFRIGQIASQKNTLMDPAN